MSTNDESCDDANFETDLEAALEDLNLMEDLNLTELNKYFSKIEPLIKEKWKSKEQEFIYEPTLFGNNSEANIKSLKIAFKQRQKQMKEGEIAQIIIGNWVEWIDLKTGHASGLDCCKNDNSIIMDVKNKYNTCNSGSEKALRDKLAKYKKEYPKTRCIWAIVNPKPGCKKLHETITHDGVEIEKIQGAELFKLVFTIDGVDYSTEVIKFARKTMGLD